MSCSVKYSRSFSNRKQIFQLQFITFVHKSNITQREAYIVVFINFLRICARNQQHPDVPAAYDTILFLFVVPDCLTNFFHGKSAHLF
jgi:hypothetical protein